MMIIRIIKLLKYEIWSTSWVLLAGFSIITIGFIIQKITNYSISWSYFSIWVINTPMLMLMSLSFNKKDSGLGRRIVFLPVSSLEGSVTRCIQFLVLIAPLVLYLKLMVVLFGYNVFDFEYTWDGFLFFSNFFFAGCIFIDFRGKTINVAKSSMLISILIIVAITSFLVSLELDQTYFQIIILSLLMLISIKTFKKNISPIKTVV